LPRPTDTVDQFMAGLDHPLKAEIEAVRAIVLGADPRITEHIKWNAPSFCYGGDDRVTLRLHPPSRLQLIFHRGAKVKDTTGFAFEDATGQITWVAPDRGIVTLGDMADIQARRAPLTELVQRWLAATGPSTTP
jgi:hypothetical protein